MKNFSRNSKIGWAMLFAGIGVALELLLNWKLFVPLLIGCFIIFYWKSHKHKDSKKIYLIIGVSLVFIPIISTAVFKIFIIAAAVYALIQYSKTKNQPKRINVNTVPPGQKTKVHRKTPFIKNMLSGNRRVVNEIFEWDDINIQCGFGNTIIDLGMTMLPPGESVVLIRGLVGNIQLIVPIDASVTINHSAISGKLNIFNQEEELLNSNVIYYSDGDDKTSRKIKIVTSVIFGDVEVRRT
ncbi:cell wall-active antibiotics response protein LiaF [Siminovitchia fortis]|uniref:cell wall-active antibiotics response protein LiaF n=1 Tax=Siminovitchia fortis TaxID=254758 RepID=UPI0011A05258|nr:cell wall-active antibiotics response protein LiaF [Siminovitchia fortis]